MSHDSRRITLVSRHTQLQQRKWVRTPEAPGRIVLLDSFTVLRYTVASLHLPDLIEEQRSFAGDLEEPWLRVRRVRECATLVTEEL